ncbi:hypothetical protein KC343_g1074 [Hortaea werneckii]|nr:hypothetical protein KC352_g12912 [Hortaea werneckii]KAI7571995.1 hypothetical protein KC317_g1148 [Hortaea werneckii]KAI7627672.1 hypothetical protein KC346_g632 [Hortaea werneckii]KAI7636795.1 hypothetical protein KC343_g1074 [Hortaea werneckii]KAI7675712.1 hypothetical protein KC319_g4512 [Hortaea werneckii]
MPANSTIERPHLPSTYEEIILSLAQTIREYRDPTDQHLETVHRFVTFFIRNVRTEEISPEGVDDFVQAVEDFRGAFLWGSEAAVIGDWQAQRRLERLSEAHQQPRQPVAWLVDVVEEIRQAVDAAEEEREAQRRRAAEAEHRRLLHAQQLRRLYMSDESRIQLEENREDRQEIDQIFFGDPIQLTEDFANRLRVLGFRIRSGNRIWVRYA